MDRRTFLRYAAATMGAGGILTSSCKSMESPKTLNTEKQPNILFIFSDDHAIQAIGAYKSRLQNFIRQQNLTPNIDRIATEGALFENSFCCNSICGPSRASILTGTHSHINGFIANEKDDFDGSQWTFPKTMQKGGYQTAVIGKWHLGSQPTGFDHWHVLRGQGNYYNPDFLSPNGEKRYEGYATDIVTELTVDWLKNKRDPNKPFMLMSQHKAPHRPWMPPKRYLNLLDDVEIPEPETLFDDYAGRTSSASDQEMTIAEHMNMDIDLKVTKPLVNNDDVPWCMKRMTGQQRRVWDQAYVPKNKALQKAGLKDKDIVRWKYQRYMKDYLRCIKAVDDSVGTLLDTLEQEDLADNTIVIYCSDQGFYLGEHGWFDKRWMYEESLKMPFVIRWPGKVTPGVVKTEMVQNIDYAPTFLEMAGLKGPKSIQGESFVPILKGNSPSDWRHSLYYHYYEYPIWHRVQKHRGVRTQRYKLIHFYPVDEWEFYDLKNDPQEMKSAYDNPEYAGIIKELKQELKRLEKKYKVPPVKIGS